MDRTGVNLASVRRVGELYYRTLSVKRNYAKFVIAVEDM